MNQKQVVFYRLFQLSDCRSSSTGSDALEELMIEKVIPEELQVIKITSTVQTE